MGLGSRIRKKTYYGARGQKVTGSEKLLKKPADALKSKEWARPKRPKQSREIDTWVPQKAPPSTTRNHKRKAERQVKVLIKNLAIFFLFPSKQFLPISLKNQLLQYLNHENWNKHIYSTWIGFEECVREETTHLATLKPKKYISYKLIAFLKTLQRLKQEWQKVKPWDQTNRWQKLGLVWRNRKKIRQFINAYLYLPFFFLCVQLSLYSEKT